MSIKAIALPALFLLSACSTLPIQTNVVNSRIYNLPKDQVWNDVIEYLATNLIQVKTLEKDSGIIFAERTNSDMIFSDCGQQFPFIAQSHPTALNILVQSESGGTKVTVNTRFTEIRRYEYNIVTADCFSTGILETQILDAVGR